jgi:hypothetical protein
VMSNLSAQAFRKGALITAGIPRVFHRTPRPFHHSACGWRQAQPAEDIRKAIELAKGI